MPRLLIAVGVLLLLAGVGTCPVAAQSVVHVPEIGNPSDGAVTGDANGTAIGHIRFLAKVQNDTWDSVNHWIKIGILNIPVPTSAPASGDPGMNVRVVSLPAGGTSFSVVDGTAFVASTSPLVPSGGVYNDSVANLGSGTAGELRLSLARALHVNLRTNAGAELVKTPNTVVPGDRNLGTLPCVANAAAPAYSETFQVACSTDLNGSQRTTVTNGSKTLTEAASYAVGDTVVAETISELVGYDGTATLRRATVKAGSVLPLATDTAVVVTSRDAVTLAANASVNLAQVSGNTISVGAGVAGPGTARINDVASAPTGAAPPAAAGYVGGLQSGATGGFLGGLTVCDQDAVININSATTTLLVTGITGRQVRICAINIGPINAAQAMALVEGTTGNCSGGLTGMAGGTTAATGWNMAANGGLAWGSGIGEVLRTATPGDSVCLINNGASQISGHLKYAVF